MMESEETYARHEDSYSEDEEIYGDYEDEFEDEDHTQQYNETASDNLIADIRMVQETEEQVCDQQYSFIRDISSKINDNNMYAKDPKSDTSKQHVQSEALCFETVGNPGPFASSSSTSSKGISENQINDPDLSATRCKAGTSLPMQGLGQDSPCSIIDNLDDSSILPEFGRRRLSWTESIKDDSAVEDTTLVPSHLIAHPRHDAARRDADAAAAAAERSWGREEWPAGGGMGLGRVRGWDAVSEAAFDASQWAWEAGLREEVEVLVEYCTAARSGDSDPGQVAGTTSYNHKRVELPRQRQPPTAHAHACAAAASRALLAAGRPGCADGRGAWWWGGGQGAAGRVQPAGDGGGLRGALPGAAPRPHRRPLPPPRPGPARPRPTGSEGTCLPCKGSFPFPCKGSFLSV